MPTIININGIDYTVIDTKEKMTVADSFVVRQNKIGNGNGEAKFYVGNEGDEARDFFDPRGFNISCFILKRDLLQYLRDSESEYKNPSQPYVNRNEMPRFWEERFRTVSALQDVLAFNLEDQDQIAPPRIYVKSDDLAYRLIRQLSLPNFTYLSAIKLLAPDGNILYYFRLFVDYFGENESQIVIEEELLKIEQQPIAAEVKMQLVRARIGQGRYREALLMDCPFCPVTIVGDDRLLIASHIKPWVVSDEREKIDPKNGFMFTPTFDLLFDRGFITFSNDKRMLVSPWLSKLTLSKLNIIPNKKYDFLPIEGREIYLEYHRNNVFKE